MNTSIFYTVKRIYKPYWYEDKLIKRKRLNKKDLVFKLLNVLQQDLKIKIDDIKRQDIQINRIVPNGQKSFHKKMIPVYRGYKKTYIKQKQSIEEGIKILKEIFKKEYN